MESSRSAWISRIESAIRSLRDVDDVHVVADGDTILDVHVVSSSNRPGKLIARDVLTLLQARFQHSIDHRLVQVSFTRNGGGHGPAVDVEEPEALEAEAPRHAPPARHERAERTTSPLPRGKNGGAPPPEASTERIRFGSVNLTVEGRQAQARVDLRWKGIERSGTAAGFATRDGALRLVAQATLAALQEFFEEGVAFGLEAVQVIHLGRSDVAVVALDLLVHRAQKTLVGSCTVEQDAQEAVALATLAALNRIVGGLPTREPTEYVLRPASR